MKSMYNTCTSKLVTTTSPRSGDIAWKQQQF